MSNINIPQKKPYIVKESAGQKYWCACGKSKNQPYCDGSHTGSGIEPIAYNIEADKKIAWCGCKHSNKKPICDGTHSKI